MAVNQAMEKGDTSEQIVVGLEESEPARPWVEGCCAASWLGVGGCRWVAACGGASLTCKSRLCSPRHAWPRLRLTRLPIGHNRLPDGAQNFAIARPVLDWHKLRRCWLRTLLGGSGQQLAYGVHPLIILAVLRHRFHPRITTTPAPRSARISLGASTQLESPPQISGAEARAAAPEIAVDRARGVPANNPRDSSREQNLLLRLTGDEPAAPPTDEKRAGSP